MAKNYHYRRSYDIWVHCAEPKHTYAYINDVCICVLVCPASELESECVCVSVIKRLDSWGDDVVAASFLVHPNTPLTTPQAPHSSLPTQTQHTHTRL